MEKPRVAARHAIYPIFAALLAFSANAANAQTTTSFTYDALGRLIQTGGPTNNTAYSYDAAGNRTIVTSVNTSSANQPPSAANDTATVTTGSSVTISVLGNDSDPDGDALTVTSASGATKGTTSITSGGTAVLYTPNAGQSGTDTFTYTISDGRGGTASAAVTVTISGNSGSSAELTSIAFTASSNYSYFNYTGLTTPGGMRDGVNNTTDSIHGTNNENNAFIQADVGSVRAIDRIDIAPAAASAPGSWGAAYLNGATVEHSTNGTTWTTVGAINGAVEGTYKSINFGGANARYIRLRMASGFLGVGDFRVYAPGSGASNQPPVAMNDTASVAAGSAVTIEVRSNDHDPDGDALTVVSATGAAKGTASITSGGTGVLYTAYAGQSGTDTFTYTISDGRGGTASATVTVTIPGPEADLTPNAVDWSNLSGSTAGNAVLTAASFQQITGISQPITLRIQINGLAGDLSSFQQNIHYNPTGAGGSAGGPWNHAEITTNNGYYDVTIEPGQWIYFDANAATVAGARSGSWTTTVTNLTTGAIIDTFTVSMAVGTASPNAVDWSNLSGSTSGNAVLTAASFQQITGINQPITLRVQVSGLIGDLSSFQQNIHYNPTGAAGSSGGPWNHAAITGNNGTFDFIIEPGQWIYFDAHATTVAGARSGGWTTTVTNLTTGAVIDTFTASLAVGQ
jgi:YD repeat-containing protein